ncbi:hypothetical protein BVG16_13805 [Paenibacillus selenitireducens]|uniref:DUF2634 domain-containing protein n=1 Tax=Paenibacillus selenitireducens TaxID=1324314 RepID=A0A1T2XCA2_9BACL|nr:hypothetical protein [Paenibacillus selenitireducens]OPA77521.1 hypothetical protein BVG16_13805 [Paenibacillus selenitireducens]
MQSLKLIDGDLVIEGGDLLMIDGVGEVIQCADLVLGTNQNEWFLNPPLGIDFGLFRGKNPDEEMMKEDIRRALHDHEPRIQSVDQIDFTYDMKNRNMEITFLATTTEGKQLRSEVGLDAR